MITGFDIDFYPAKEWDGFWDNANNAQAACMADVTALVAECINFFTDLGGIIPSEDGIRHNLNAWLRDCKSGYRDEERGYFLFTPCGCNPFRINLTKIDAESAGWQKTYIAYACPSCGRITDKGSKWFFMPNDIRVSIAYIF